MSSIFKYNLRVETTQVLKLPIGAEILSIQNQNGQLALWCLVPPSRGVENVHFLIYGTGESIPEIEKKYLDTVQVGPYVWHVFKKEQKQNGH